jgi:hypothetical protein
MANMEELLGVRGYLKGSQYFCAVAETVKGLGRAFGEGER